MKKKKKCQTEALHSQELKHSTLVLTLNVQKKFLQVAKKKKEALANVITIFKGIDDDADLPVIQ